MPSPVSRAFAITAIDISERDSSAQAGQVTGNLNVGSGISLPLSWVSDIGTIDAASASGLTRKEK